MTVENRGLQLQAVCCALVASAFVSTLLRCYVRVRIVRNFGFDDSCMVVALVSHSIFAVYKNVLISWLQISFVLFVTCALLGVHYGTGRHYWDLEIGDREQAMKVLLARFTIETQSLTEFSTGGFAISGIASP